MWSSNKRQLNTKQQGKKLEFEDTIDEEENMNK